MSQGPATAGSIGHVHTTSGAVIEVRASTDGVTMVGGAPSEPFEAEALARLLLEGAQRVRALRERVSRPVRATTKAAAVNRSTTRKG
jgi:hypothetical protein